VVPPPVAVENFYWKPSEDYYLIVSELVAYKQLDMAIRVFAKNGRKLRVVGDGPELRSLRRIAAGNIEFCGRMNHQELRELYARCRAFLMPGEEDFGITAVEALASGKPVIALGRGGVLETVPVADPVGGVFYIEASDQGLCQAIEQWDHYEHQVVPQALQAYAARFSLAEFSRKMKAILCQPPSPGDVANL
jgi:glycosyltransferase involved in cell wall biosynthesis